MVVPLLLLLRRLLLLPRSSFTARNNNNNNNNNNGGNQDVELDPYDIHLSKNPTTVCVTPQLEWDSNYHGMTKRMQRVLAANNKFRFLNDSISISKAGDLNYVAWERCNNLIHSWLINYMKPYIAKSVVYIKNEYVCGTTSNKGICMKIGFMLLRYIKIFPISNKGR